MALLGCSSRGQEVSGTEGGLELPPLDVDVVVGAARRRRV